ncbi:MAG TPA: hypothetical protein VIL01_03785 [Thermomicrobiales bacterium]
MPLDTLSREYVALAFRIERLFPGFVDAYFGPPELKEEAEREEAPSPESLLERAQALAEAIETADLIETRKDFLAAQVRAMITVCRKLRGETLDYRDEVRGMFDIEADKTPEAVFEGAIAEIDELLPGDGDVRERMLAWRSSYVVPVETARTLIDTIAEEARKRTQSFVELPPGEEVEFAFVSDKPWSGYNWYLGNYRSRVEINTDLPIHAHELTGLIAHEAYPGHHTEHSLKERLLYREQGYGEHTIQLINTPQCVISEGIATLAETIIFPGDSGPQWQAEQLYPLAGLTGDPEREARIARARRALQAVSANAALMLHVEGKSESEVLAYLQQYGLRSEEQARHNFRFISDPFWRAYIFTYHAGRDLLGRWLEAVPVIDRPGRFRLLLVGQLTPSAIRSWLADEQAVP